MVDAKLDLPGIKVPHGPSQPNAPPVPKPSADSDDSSDSEGDSDSEDEEPVRWQSYYRPPTIPQAEAALAKLDRTVRTPIPSGGYKYMDLDQVTSERIAAIKACLNQFVYAEPKGQRFIEASVDAARIQSREATYARTIHKWTWRLIQKGDLPGNAHGWWNVSTLEDEDVSSEIKLHLQGIGKYACAHVVVEFLCNPEVRAWLKIKKKFSLRTAQRWFSQAGFSWSSKPKGQYFDRHEREDVVTYRQTVYIPFLKKLDQR